jgi:hypothetical protein
VRLLGATVLSAFGLAAFSPLPNVVAGWVSTPADLGKADAIVVLGGGSEWPRGELNSTTLHRTSYLLDDIVWLLVALLQGLAWSLWRCDGEG